MAGAVAESMPSIADYADSILNDIRPFMSPALHRHTPALSVVDPRGLAVRAVEWHRTEVASPPEARITRHRFDAAERPVRHQDPRFFAQGETGPSNLSTVFSLSGRVLASDSMDAGWRIELVTEDGLRQEHWDGRDSHVQVEYDSLRRPTAIFEQGACVERFTYGAADADAGYNLRNVCIRHDDPAGSRHFPGYDVKGVLQEERQYFLSEPHTPDWPEAIPARDALLESAEELTTRYRYLASGEPLERTDARGNRLQQHYSVAGRLARSELQPVGQTTAHVLVSEIRYNAFAQVERQVAGNGIVTLTEYDPASGYLQRLQCRRGASGSTLQDLRYDYDPVGNVIGHEDQSVETLYHANRRIDPLNTYAYDTLYQLILATGRERIGAGMGPDLPEPVGHGPVDPTLIGAYTRRYDYDAGGNLLLMQHRGQNNQLHTLRMAVSGVSNKALVWREGLDTAQIENAFDANGNARELQAGQTLQWDARNQLQRVALVQRAQGEDDSEVYVYGGGGQRLRKHAIRHASGVSHISETRYLPGLELHTDSATGQRWQVITIGAGRSKIRLLHWDDAPPEGLLNDQLYYGFDNHLGSSTLETDATGQLCSREEYYPFGGTALLAARNALEVSFKTIRYSGKERDATGLYYYGFRYLAPWLHRWINPDPAGAVDGLNLFGFVGNNPVTVVDRDGLVGSDDDINPYELADFLEENVPLDTHIGVPSELLHQLEAPARVSEDPMFSSPVPSPALSTISITSSLRFPEGIEDLDLPEPDYVAPADNPPGLFYRIPTTSAPQPSWNYVPSAGSATQPGAMLPPAPRRFICTHAGCGKSFTRPAKLAEHIRTHTGERAYPCTECGKNFARRDNLAVHRRTHTGEKPHSCTVAGCGQSFLLRNNLIVHGRTHTGEKPYSCTVAGCRQSFSRSGSLLRHHITHTGERPYSCTECGKSFTLKANLKMHIRRFHSRSGP